MRKSKKQKEQFRSWLCGQLRSAGYETREEKSCSLITSCNVVVGDPDRAEVIFTAHYDTCAGLPFPNFITPQNPLVYVLYQLLIALPLFLAVAVVEVAIFFAVGALGWGEVLWWLAPAASLALCVGFIWWLMDGPANQSNVNDNTSGVLALLELALTLPPEQRGRAAFVFFDNEEKGLFGSAGFARAHRKKMQAELLINFDCVSDGDHILLFPRKKAKAGAQRLEQAYQSTPEKQVKVIRGFGFYPSDQKHFAVGVGVAAMHRRPLLGYCLGRIHTKRDTVLDERNIELLRQGSIRLLTDEPAR